MQRSHILQTKSGNFVKLLYTFDTILVQQRNSNWTTLVLEVSCLPCAVTTAVLGQAMSVENSWKTSALRHITFTSCAA